MALLSVEQFSAALEQGAIPLDLRSPAAFAAGHIPGSINLQFGRQDLADRAELFLPRTDPYLLVAELPALGQVAGQLLGAAGYQITGSLQGGLPAWTGAGRPLQAIATMAVDELHHLLDSGETPHLIDVREEYEYDWGHVRGAVNLPQSEMAARLSELDPTRPYLIICNDQIRSGATAGLLLRSGIAHLTLVLGGTAAWLEAGYPLTKSD